MISECSSKNNQSAQYYSDEHSPSELQIHHSIPSMSSVRQSRLLTIQERISMRQRMLNNLGFLSCLAVTCMSELEVNEYKEHVLKAVHSIKQKRKANGEIQFDSPMPTPQEVDLIIFSFFASNKFNKCPGHEFDVQQTAMTKKFPYPADPIFKNFFKVLLPMLLDLTYDEFLFEFQRDFFKVLDKIQYFNHSDERSPSELQIQYSIPRMSSVRQFRPPTLQERINMRPRMLSNLEFLSSVAVTYMSELEVIEFKEHVLKAVQNIKQKQKANAEMQFDSPMPIPQDVDLIIFSFFTSNIFVYSPGHEFDVQQTAMTKKFLYPADPIFINFFKLLLPMLLDLTCDEYLFEFQRDFFTVLHKIRGSNH